MRTANEYENKYWAENRLVVGIDEAGRGPLAGPLVVAGVVFPIGYDTNEIYDSKKLSAKKREELYQLIIKDALFYQIEVVNEETIDSLNIYQATKKAMSAIANAAPVEVVLTDAMKLDINKEVIDIIKGDMKSGSIAAGSILAKVTRDHIMEMLDGYYPGYHLSQNKGYPTKDHLEALSTIGSCSLHRKSYGPVILANQQKLF